MGLTAVMAIISFLGLGDNRFWKGCHFHLGFTARGFQMVVVSEEGAVETVLYAYKGGEEVTYRTHKGVGANGEE